MKRARFPANHRSSAIAAICPILAVAALMASGCSNFSEVAEIINPTREALAGGITIQVTPTAWDPYISFEGVRTTLLKGTSMTVKASVNPQADSLEWYVDDIRIDAVPGDEATFGSDLKTGQHSVSLIARKGNHLASSQFQFTVNLAITK